MNCGADEIGQVTNETGEPGGFDCLHIDASPQNRPHMVQVAGSRIIGN